MTICLKKKNEYIGECFIEPNDLDFEIKSRYNSIC